MTAYLQAVYCSRSTSIDAGVWWASWHCIYWHCSPPTCVSFAIALVVTTTPEPTRTSPPLSDAVLQRIARCKGNLRLEPPIVSVSDCVTASSIHITNDYTTSQRSSTWSVSCIQLIVILASADQSFAVKQMTYSHSLP